MMARDDEKRPHPIKRGFLGRAGTERYFNVGCLTWILPGEHRTFMLWGAHGQRIYVDARSKLVMLNTAALRGD
jgi:hypothetical protein